MAENSILQAEQFKAQVIAPKGNNFCNINMEQLSPEVELLTRNDNDNDFFHITCHVDPGLKAKIERGEFIELEKLLAKDGSTRMLNEEKQIELVSRGGATFFTQVQDRDCKINSIRKWEQAFRIYAAIYTKANPERATEIGNMCM